VSMMIRVGGTRGKKLAFATMAMLP
jgi:hypothetical protein